MEAGIKFVCHWQYEILSYEAELLDLNYWRSLLCEENLIGVADGIAYGNISMRIDTSKAFLISATATGSKERLTSEDISLVYSYDLPKNEIFCRGQAKASSESPSHAALYELSSEIMAVVHVHHEALWLSERGAWPTTDEKAEYGSPEMASAIRELWHSGAIQQGTPIVMGGHKDGLLAFGSDLATATRCIVDALSRLQSG